MKLLLSPALRWGTVLLVGVGIFYLSVFTAPPQELVESGNSALDTSASGVEQSSDSSGGTEQAQSQSSSKQADAAAVALQFIRANWVHVASYALFGLTLVYATVGWDQQRWQIILSVFALAMGYGCAIEVVQLLVPARSLQTTDMLANTIGAGSVALLYGGSVSLVWLWRRRAAILRE
jgi:VanZ family protein